MFNQVPINFGLTNLGAPIDDTSQVHLKRFTAGEQTISSVQLGSVVLVWKTTRLPLQHWLNLHNCNDLMKETWTWKSKINHF